MYADSLLDSLIFVYVSHPWLSKVSTDESSAEFEYQNPTREGLLTSSSY